MFLYSLKMVKPSIQYLDTTKECNIVKELFIITEENLKSTNYSLNMSDYLEDEEINLKSKG